MDWIIAFDGYPVGVVEVKKLARSMTLLGISIMASFTMIYFESVHFTAFGLFTNWDEWVFGWLEDSDEFASATDSLYEMNNSITYSSPSKERK